MTTPATRCLNPECETTWGVLAHRETTNTCRICNAEHYTDHDGFTYLVGSAADQNAAEAHSAHHAAIPAPEPRFPEVAVQLTGRDGNAFAILGAVSKALKRAGHPEAAAEYITEATAGDYNHLLATTMRYVDAH